MIVAHFDQGAQNPAKRRKQTMEIAVLLVHAENLGKPFGYFQFIRLMRASFLGLYLFGFRSYVFEQCSVPGIILAIDPTVPLQLDFS